MTQLQIAAIAIGVVLILVALILWRKSKNPIKTLWLNWQEDRSALQALYMLAHDVIHADGREEKRELEMVVTLVRELLGQPDMDEDFILREYRLHSQQKLDDAELQALSLQYRRTLLHCAVRIARSDLQLPDQELSRLHDAARKLNLNEEEVFKAFEKSADINREEFKRRFSETPKRNMHEWACEVLNVASDSTQAQIAESFKREAKASFPGRAKAEDREKAKARFKEVREAYNILRKRHPVNEEDAE